MLILFFSNEVNEESNKVKLEEKIKESKKKLRLQVLVFMGISVSFLLICMIITLF